jgi:hypothetical protein
LAVLSAILYRLGGKGKPFNTKFRDLGCPVCLTACVVTLLGFSWSLIPCFGLFFGSLTTYWKKKGANAEWYNWLLVGLGYSISLLPWAIATHNWLGFGIRTFVLITLTTLWKTLVGNAVLSELGEGAIIILTIPLLLIGRKK